VTLLIAPTVAVLGLIATFLVIRSRYREKQSLYETLRAERREQIEKARRRAISEADEPSPTPTPAAATPASQPPEAVAPEGAPPSGIAAIRAEAIQRGRTRSIAGVAALVASLVLVLLGVVLAIVESRLT
jgi:hypothetical protein